MAHCLLYKHEPMENSGRGGGIPGIHRRASLSNHWALGLLRSCSKNKVKSGWGRPQPCPLPLSPTCVHTHTNIYAHSHHTHTYAPKKFVRSSWQAWDGLTSVAFATFSHAPAVSVATHGQLPPLVIESLSKIILEAHNFICWVSEAPQILLSSVHTWLAPEVLELIVSRSTVGTLGHRLNGIFSFMLCARRKEESKKGEEWENVCSEV